MDKKQKDEWYKMFVHAFHEVVSPEFVNLDKRMSEVENRLGKVEGQLNKVESRLTKVKKRLIKVERNMATRNDVIQISRRLDKHAVRLDHLEAFPTIALSSTHFVAHSF